MEIKKKIKAELSKFKFSLGFNPKIHMPSQELNFVPTGKRAVVTITADFELAWATRYSHKLNGSIAKSLEMARRERRNIHDILDLCEQYDIPITWATVGHLFLHSCKRENGQVHSEIPAVPNYHGKYWSFQSTDWFEHDPCSDLNTDPEWYAPDLINRILLSNVGHEIGCHTFSHIDCRDGICPPDLFKKEIQVCQKLASQKSIHLESFVHPGHTIGNLDWLQESGFTSYQSDPGNILGYPIKKAKQFWELQRTMEFVYRPEWSMKYHRKRYKQIVDRAIKRKALCNFWFHPSFPEILTEELLPDVFEYLAKRKSAVLVVSVGDYVDFLNSTNG